VGVCPSEGVSYSTIKENITHPQIYEVFPERFVEIA